MGKARKPTAFPETASAAEIAGFVGLSERRVYQLAQEGAIPAQVGPSSYPFRECVLAIVERERRAATGDDAQRSNDRARRERAEADSAEMDAEKKRGTLMLAADARRWWADGFAKVRDVIARSGIKAEEKKRISEQLLKIKLDDDQ